MKSSTTPPWVHDSLDVLSDRTVDRVGYINPVVLPCLWFEEPNGVAMVDDGGGYGKEGAKW